MDSVEAQLNLAIVSRHMLDAVIHAVVRARAEQYSQLEAAEVTTDELDEPEQDEPMMAGENEDEQQASSIVLWFIVSQLPLIRFAAAM